jgi:flagellar hook-associated protein 1 FlgK
MLDPANNTPSASTRPLDGAVAGGTLRGLLDLRDTVIPGLQAQMGELAAGADALNAISNAYSAVPPPTTLTGRNTGLLGSDVYNTSSTAGTLNVAIVDATGMAVGGVQAVTITPGMTVTQVVAAINGALGANGTASFTNGVLSITSNVAGAGVVLQDGATPASRGGRGFSHFFGLNDLFQSASPLHFQTGLTATDAHGISGGTIDLELRTPNNDLVRGVSITPAAGGTMQDVLDALNDPTTGFGGYLVFSLDSSGQLVSTAASGYSSLRLETISDTTVRGGTGLSLSELFGIGSSHRIDMAANFAVSSSLSGQPSRLPTAALSAAGTPNLAASDGSGAQAYQSLYDTPLQFAAAGSIGAVRMSLSQYAASILTASGQSAAEAAARVTDRQALTGELSARQSSVSGVNMDEELANMIVYQQAYGACARLITTTKELYDTLLSIAN